MIDNNEYEKIPKDMSGSRTKNRFNYEVAYGIKKIYDLFVIGEDFFVIFDNACDLEIGTKGKMDFYQVKTKNTKYSLNSLIKFKKGEKSILQNLINLKCSSIVDKLFIVSNSPLNIKSSDTKNGKVNVEEFCFDNLTETQQNTINKNLIWPNNSPFWNSIFYLTSDLCLNSSQTTLLGYTTKFLEDLYNGPLCNISDFQKTIETLVKQKSSYELETSTLKETIDKKGVTAHDLKCILDSYQKNILQSTIVSIDNIKTWCGTLGLNMETMISVKTTYFRMFSKGYIDELINKKISEIKEKYNSNEYKTKNNKEAITSMIDDDIWEPNFTREERILLSIFGYEQLWIGENYE